MKKVTEIIVALVLSVSLVGVGQAASAIEIDDEPDCDVLVINGNGNGSENEIVCTTVVDVDVECVNNIYVLNENSQEALSGAAIVGGNYNGGTAISGNATNENGLTVAIGASCGPEEEEVPVTPVTPQTPGVGAAAAQKVTALPFTAGSSLFESALISAIVLGTVLVSARLAVVAYRRLAIK